MLNHKNKEHKTGPLGKETKAQVLYKFFFINLRKSSKNYDEQKQKIYRNFAKRPLGVVSYTLVNKYVIEFINILYIFFLVIFNKIF